MSDLTQILQQIETGDPSAADRLLPLVYEDLRALAAAKIVNEPSDQTLQATALVHEAWLRLAGSDGRVSWENRRHFFAAAAEAMRRVLIDAARRRGRLKRGGDGQRVDIDLSSLPGLGPDTHLLALNEALESLAARDPEKAELVKLRFFAGLTIGQAADMLGISTSTADRHWSYARAWLFREIARAGDDSGD
jgi:RNA polymerase sigma factor (TIGR02999 family)